MVTGHYVASLDRLQIEEWQDSRWTSTLYAELDGFTPALRRAHARLDAGEAITTRHYLFSLSEQAIRAELCETCGSRGVVHDFRCPACHGSGLRAERELVKG